MLCIDFQSGEIRQVHDDDNNDVTLFLQDENREETVSGELLEPFGPMQGDRVKVILGEMRGITGQLLAIDQEEANFMLDSNDVIKLPLKFLCKMV